MILNKKWRSILCLAVALLPTSLGSLHAKNTATKPIHKHKNHAEKKAVFSELKHSLSRLQKLSGRVKNSTTLASIQKVISTSKKTLRMGKNHSNSSVKKAKKSLSSIAAAIEYIQSTYIQSTASEKSSSASSVRSHKTAAKSNVYAHDRVSLQHFTQIQGQVQTVLDKLQANANILYNEPTAISNLPYTITRPGRYYLSRNLFYRGNQAAISIKANNVTLDFSNYTLSLATQNSSAILAQNVRDLMVVNGRIQGDLTPVTSPKPAVSFAGVSNAQMGNLSISSGAQSIQITGSSGCSLEDSFIENGGIVNTDSSAISILRTFFQGNSTPLSNALFIQGSSENVSIRNSTFVNWQNSFTVNQVTGLLIEDCLIKGSVSEFGPLMTFGTSTTQANSIQLRNCVFEQTAATQGIDGLLFVNGSGCLLKNSLVDLATGHSANYQGAAVHIVGFDNFVAQKCIVKGPNDYGLYVDNGSHNSCIDCQFTDAKVANILLSGAKSCIIRACKVSDALGSGILINNSANGNAVVNCEISNNQQDGLVVEQNALKNHIIQNNVFENVNNGISNNESTSTTFYNVVCNNGVADCPAFGVNPEQTPGVEAILPGSNICCIP